MIVAAPGPTPGASSTIPDGVCSRLDPGATCGPSTYLSWDCKIATRRGEADFQRWKRVVTGPRAVLTRNTGVYALIVRMGRWSTGISDEKLTQLGTSLFFERVLHWAALVRFAGR